MKIVIGFVFATALRDSRARVGMRGQVQGHGLDPGRAGRTPVQTAEAPRPDPDQVTPSRRHDLQEARAARPGLF